MKVGVYTNEVIVGRNTVLELAGNLWGAIEGQGKLFRLTPLYWSRVNHTTLIV